MSVFYSFLFVIIIMAILVVFYYKTLSEAEANDTKICNISDCIHELLRRSQVTSKARYHAARRLAWHGWFSQWTLALLATGQIVIALSASINVHKNFSPEYINFASIFFGVVVLAYSLLLGMANFTARSVKLHNCGLELGRLVRELTYLSIHPGVVESDYSNAHKKYYDILDKHENHTKVDYITAGFDHDFGLNIKSKSIISCFKIFAGLLRIYLLHILQFSHYVVSMGVMFVWIYFLLRKC